MCRDFSSSDICIELLCNCSKRHLLLVYREENLAQHLAQAGVQTLLRKNGYDTSASFSGLLQQLKIRLAQSNNFPHEIGLFLGYPLEDVAGFCLWQGKGYKYSGQWKVYGDVAKAQATFARYDKCRNALCKRVQQGMSLAQIFCA